MLLNSIFYKYLLIHLNMYFCIVYVYYKFAYKLIHKKYYYFPLLSGPLVFLCFLFAVSTYIQGTSLIFNSWLPDGDEMQKAMDSMVGNAYLYGRNWIAARVRIYNGFHFSHGECLPVCKNKIDIRVRIYNRF